MNPGDMIVQSVREDLVVQDIRLSLPRGIAVVVPGNSFYDSRDLGRLMSEGRVVQLNNHPRLGMAPQQLKVVEPEPIPVVVDDPELAAARDHLYRAQEGIKDLEAESQRLREELDESRKECGQLLAECNKLREELSSFRNSDAKLEAILNKIDSIPAQTVVVEKTKGSDEPVLDPDVPIFIPKDLGPVKKLDAKKSSAVGEDPAKSVKMLKRLRKPEGS